MARERLSKYLHEMIFIIWMDIQEWVLVIILYAFWIIDPSLFKFALMLLIPVVLIPIKRRQSRGFLMHIFYYLGFRKLHFYPPAMADTFVE